MYAAQHAETASFNPDYIAPVKLHDRNCARDIHRMFREYNPEDWTIYTFRAREYDRNRVFGQLVDGLKNLGYQYVNHYHWLGWYRFIGTEGRICAVRARPGGVDVAYHNSTRTQIAGLLT